LTWMNDCQLKKLKTNLLLRSLTYKGIEFFVSH